MTSRDEDLLLRAMEGELQGEEASALAARLLREPELMDRFVGLARDEAIFHEVVPHLSMISARVAKAPSQTLSPFRLFIRRAIPFAAAATLLIAFGLYFQIANVEASRRGRIVSVSGGDLQPAGMKPGGVVGIGQSLRTGRDGRIEFTYDDRTVVELGPETTVHLVAGRKRGMKVIAVQSGWLSTHVAPQSPDAPMVIQTPQSTATVLGTAFSVRVDDAGSFLSVATGVVRVATISGAQTADVRSGQAAQIGMSGIVLSAIPAAQVTTPQETESDDATLPWRSLLNGADLSNWEIMKGSWSMDHGEMVGEDTDVDRLVGAQIDTHASYDSFELVCKIRAEISRFAEIHIADRGYVFPIEFPEKNTWRTVRILATGAYASLWLDGVLVPRDTSDGSGLPGRGKISFFVTRNGKVRIKDIRIRELPVQAELP